MMKIVKSWFLPFGIAVLMFAVARPAIAQLIDLPSGNVNVGEEVKDGFSTIFYEYNGSRNYVSPKAQNSKSPDSKGEYIVWVTEVADRPGQVFLYHIPTSSTIQLTSTGTNQNPKVTIAGKVVWQGWVEDRWQIFLFDGTKTEVLTQGDVSFNPNIEGDNIAFTRQDISGTYRSVVYSISKKESKDISTGVSSKNPRTREGKIFLGEEEFPLTVDDLFLLNFAPLTGAESSPSAKVSPEDIMEEISASPSAEVAPESATESGSMN